MKKKTKTRIAIKVEEDLINDVKNIKDSSDDSLLDGKNFSKAETEVLGEPAALFASLEEEAAADAQPEEELLQLDPDLFEAHSRVSHGAPPKEESEVLDLGNNTEDKTIAISNINKASSGHHDLDLSQNSAVSGLSEDDKTVAVAGMARVVSSQKKSDANPEMKTKVSYGAVRASARTGAATAMTSPEATFLQADNLRIAQTRILELEKELERVRIENEELASAGETMRLRSDDLQTRLAQVDNERKEAVDSLEAEIHLLKNSLQYKEIETRGLKAKIEELEGRLSSDLKKIRLRERELENRLELLRMEKTALVQSKDEALMDLKRKMDQLKTECDNYRNKCQELNKTIDQNQEQFRRTVRALRLALTNLEVGEDTVFPLKKAE